MAKGNFAVFEGQVKEVNINDNVGLCKVTVVGEKNVKKENGSFEVSLANTVELFGWKNVLGDNFKRLCSLKPGMKYGFQYKIDGKYKTKQDGNQWVSMDHYIENLYPLSAVQTAPTPAPAPAPAQQSGPEDFDDNGIAF